MADANFLLRAYLDEIDRVPLNKKTYQQRNRLWTKEYLWPSIKWFIKGNLLLKENAKSNFRTINRNLKGYKDYVKLRKTIQNWVGSKANIAG